MSNLSYKGKSFNQRENDGYVNLDQLCATHGKKQNDWRRLKLSNAYLETLSRKTGIPATDLIIVQHDNATWGHPLVAIDIAYWINPKFGIWCSQHIKTLIETGSTAIASLSPQQSAPQQPQLPQVTAIALAGLDAALSGVINPSLLAGVKLNAIAALHPETNIALNEGRKFLSHTSVPEQDLMQLLQAIAADHPEAVLDRVRAIMNQGREPLVVLQNLTSFYRDLLIAKTASDRTDLVAITPATWAELRQFAQTQDVGKILQGQQHLRACEAQIKNTTQPRLWLEVALLGLLPSALNVTQQVVANPNPHYCHIKKTNTTRNDLQSLWQQVLAHLPLPSQALFKQQGTLISVQEHEVRLGFRSQNLIKIAAEPRLPLIKAAFTQVLGRAIQVRLEVFGDSEIQNYCYTKKQALEKQILEKQTLEEQFLLQEIIAEEEFGSLDF